MSNSYLRFNRPRSMLAAMSFGNCGYAFPTIVGAKVAAPDRPAIAYVGDGAWGMSFGEIQTCVRENIPVTAVVFNNGQWGAEKKNHVDFYARRFVGVNLDKQPSWAAVAKAMGEEKGLAYFQKLAAMRPQIRSGHTLMTELVAAGEIPVVLTLYNQAVDKLKERGAPIDWKPLPPAFGRADGIGVAKQAPHPHAALLFADFVLSPEGQRFIMAASRVPVNRKVGSSFNQRDFRIVELAPVVDEWDTWEKRWQTLFLKGQK